MPKLYLILILSIISIQSNFVLAASNTNELTLESLLNTLKQGKRNDDIANKERIEQFTQLGSERQKKLSDIIEKRKSLEKTSSDKEKLFEDNDQKIASLETRLSDKMGSLKELFGVLQQVSGDAQGQFSASLTQLEHSERIPFLIEFSAKMGQANRLPKIEEIERLWLELQTEMTASARVATKEHTVLLTDGSEVTLDVTRIGLFNAVADGKYLKFIPETGRLIEYSRQPSSRYLAGPRALQTKKENELIPFAIDPVRGQLIDILTQAPKLSERLAQGGTIGYAIIALGVAGVLFALFRLATLIWQGHIINRQMLTQESPRKNNPLGRIMLAVSENNKSNTDTLELHLSDAVLREVPKINAYIPILKIIAAVAPLMGLLGTVTGMIVTFQAITLFGAGDPRLMAGGISQALITTVLGLCVAVPMLLLHSLVQMRAKSLTDLLQQEAVALIANHTAKS